MRPIGLLSSKREPPHRQNLRGVRVFQIPEAPGRIPECPKPCPVTLIYCASAASAAGACLEAAPEGVAEDVEPQEVGGPTW